LDDLVETRYLPWGFAPETLKYSTERKTARNFA
jgi:hypothetical protein